MEATEAGVPVVATRTRSLEGYVVEGVTALLVAPGDAAALRAAVDRLLGNDGKRDRIRQAAFGRSQQWTGRDYLDAIASLLIETPE